MISVPGKNGKLTAEDVERVYRLHWRMPLTNICHSQNLSIFLIRQRLEQFIQKRNWKHCGRYVIGAGCICFWMEQDWDMVWQRRIMIWIWKALRQTVMCFISEGRKWEHSSERLLSSVIQNCRRLPLSDQTKRRYAGERAAAWNPVFGASSRWFVF